ncbi:MAG: lysoplasmalogenase [Acidobacteria bacterium]|nr:lysoplasmalogenase [Acidobacteriota bacterium]
MTLRIVSVLFFIALAAEIFALATGSAGIEFVAKPLLMPILIVYFAINTNGPDRTRLAMIAALGFSWLGDVLLMFDKHSGGMFVYGLAAFLTAHLLYIYFFVRIRKLNRVEKLPNALVFVAIAFYSSALFGFVAPWVGEMLIPVAVYAIVISTMFAASLAAFRFADQDFGKWCVAGTLLFVISDSILAVNRFAAPFPVAPILVMLTYGTAQFLICEGAKRNLV